MATNLERYKADLERLIATGKMLYYSLCAEYLPDQAAELCKEIHLSPTELLEKHGFFDAGYQSWYSEAQALVKQLLPGRLADFVGHYEAPQPRTSITWENYRIADCLLALRMQRDHDGKILVDEKAAINHFKQQVRIVRAVKGRLESSLFGIRQLVQADLFRSELEAARELAKNGYLRAAGVVAGVVLEKHLAQVATNHNISGKKPHPSIGDLNGALKDGDVYDVPDWRLIQRLADIRNICCHGASREPTSEDIQDLIDGTDKIMKTVF